MPHRHLVEKQFVHFAGRRPPQPQRVPTESLQQPEAGARTRRLVWPAGGSGSWGFGGVFGFGGRFRVCRRFGV